MTDFYPPHVPIVNEHPNPATPPTPPISEEIEDLSANKKMNEALDHSLIHLPANWEEDDVAKHFVQNMRTIDTKTKNLLCARLSQILTSVERTNGRENKKEVALKLFKKLSQEKGKQFVLSNWNFYKVCRAKMIHFYNVEGFEEMKPLFQEIFGTPIPLE